MPENKIDSVLDRISERPIYQYLLLAGITLLAVALRLYKLGEWSFWIDEIYTINRAQIHFNDFSAFIRSLPSTLWLPISVILTNLSLGAFGVTEWSARLVSVVIGIATVPILYFSSRKFLSPRAGLIMALLLAVSTWHIFWSQNARFYTSLLLLYTLAGLAFYLAMEEDRPWLIVVFYLLFYFALSERLIAGFLLPGVVAYLGGVWLFRLERPPGWHRRSFLLLGAPFLLMILAEAVRYWVTGASLTTFFIEDFGGKLFDDPVRLAIAIVFNITLPVLFLGVVSGIYLIVKRSRAGLFLLISALLPVVLLVLLNPLTFTKDRYVFMTLPSWIMLSALAIDVLLNETKGVGKLLALGVLGIFVVNAAGSDVLYYQVNNGNRLNWRTAFQIVQENSQPEDRVVAYWPEFAPFYLDREIEPWEEAQLDEIKESGRRYWFVLDYETFWANRPVKHLLETRGQLIDVLYLRQPEDNFYLRVYLYDPALDPPQN